MSSLSARSKRKIFPFSLRFYVRRSIAYTCEEGDIDGRFAKCSRENNFGRQPSTVPTDARDSFKPLFGSRGLKRIKMSGRSLSIRAFKVAGTGVQ